MDTTDKPVNAWDKALIPRRCGTHPARAPAAANHLPEGP